MSDVMKADLDAIRALAGKQHDSASTIRGLDVGKAFSATISGLAGSDVEAVCARAETAVEAALAEVAARVDALADANRTAAETVGLADDTYAASIRATLNMEP
ncbi:hypothetical protein OG579_19000 [Williamsia herbipolensis]|uniref:Excreted virulence factor EspC, type VII ESX diderm n=1 Tax=Williamsia herbipolensis TaxID=1603258 RepID=A0AAU4K0Y9_9NOCA|nr:hypothetical protein [Williamsia herbipolensis]